jgi:hypothetical protein
MSRAFNFSAGPAALPEPVLRQVQDEMLEWQGERASVMEVSHRGQAFVDCAAAAERDLRGLMAIPDDYHVLFLQGGATTISALLPLNLAGPGASADYVLTGHWGEKAVENARPSLTVNIAASAKDGGYTGIPARDGWKLTPGAAYVHYTPNETIHGVEFHDIPDVGGVPLVADISSNFLSAPVDVSRFGVLYAMSAVVGSAPTAARRSLRSACGRSRRRCVAGPISGRPSSAAPMPAAAGLSRKGGTRVHSIALIRLSGSGRETAAGWVSERPERPVRGDNSKNQVQEGRSWGSLSGW